MKKISLIVFLVLISLFVSRAASEDVNSALMQFASEVPHARVGVTVMRVSDKKVIGELNGERALIPASVMKSITTASAMEMMGSEYRFHTKVLLSGELKKKGEFKGNIIIKGGADPTLGSKFFPNHSSFMSTLLDSLRSRGIKSIKGDIIIQDSIYPAPSVCGDWMLNDIALDYGAGSFGINFEDNAGKICIDFSGRKGVLVRSYPESLDVIVNDYSVRNNSKRTSIELFRNYDSNVINIYGTHNQKDSHYWIDCSMPFPSQMLRDSIYKNIEKGGIEFNYKNIKHLSNEFGDSMILDYLSPNLQEISTSLMERSDNMFAQTVLRGIAMNEDTLATPENAINILEHYWENKGLPINQLRMIDGSGLARSNAITPHLLTLIIATAQTDMGTKVNFSSIFPRAGESGTVKRLLSDSKYKGKFGLKSGSMIGVLCYTGFYPIDNPQYAISVMINNYSLSFSQLRTTIERLLINIANGLEVE